MVLVSKTEVITVGTTPVLLFQCVIEDFHSFLMRIPAGIDTLAWSLGNAHAYAACVPVFSKEVVSMSHLDFRKSDKEGQKDYLRIYLVDSTADRVVPFSSVVRG